MTFYALRQKFHSQNLSSASSFINETMAPRSWDARQVILSNVLTNSNFTWVNFWSTFHVTWGILSPAITFYMTLLE